MGTNTGIGIGIGIPFKNNVLGEGKPYLPPEIKDSLKAVVIAYGKTNNDSDRAIVKNLVDASNPFVISNAAFKLNSGYGKYEEDFTTWVGAAISINNGAGFKIERNNTGWWGFSTYGVKATNEFKIKVTNCRDAFSWRYKDAEGIWQTMNITKDGIYTLPASQEKDEHDAPRFFNGNPNATYNGLTVEQIPSYQGAFVTDGINDLITSTKTVQEMLGGSSEYTVLSMIHHIDVPEGNIHSNTVRIKLGSWGTSNRITSFSNNKTGIYGYTVKNQNITVINNILGDKNDYGIRGGDYTSNLEAKFSVVGWIGEDDILRETASIAWYWTIIANKVLTTDEINQVIAYFNLDRTLNPDILCNTIKQGITNENHAEFGDKLIDFSGNGRDIQLNNLAWDGDSGIGKYNYPNWKVTATIANTYSTIVNYPTVNGTYSINVNGVSELMQSIGLHLEIKYTISTGIIYNDIKQDGVYSYILPDGSTDLTLRFGGIPGIVNEPCNITITQIPSHAGALCLDGVNDFGKVTGMPIYKDYTVVTDREIFANTGAISSKNNPGAFVETVGNSVYSFGQATSGMNFISTRSISYLSKYSYCGQSITAGAAEDGTDMWLGTIRDGDSRFFNGAIYSLMSFPYSMSEFLIERQLKKHKLGTLYPDMVEFRPVIKSNVLLDAKPTFVIRGTSTYLNAGDYVPENSQIWVSIKMNNIADRITNTVNGKTIDIPENAYSEVTLQYGFPFVIDKSPQKISITIEQDENYVLFNPVINSNYDNYKLTFHLREYEKLINIGDYIPKGTYIRANLYLKNDIDELVTFTFNGVNIDYAKSPVLDTAYNIRQIYNYGSPQEVNITIDEYIRYEDIVQPYPVLLRFNDENGNEVSWGGKFKVGSTITRIGSIADPESNLLNGLYSISGLSLNGKSVTSSTSIVEKQMVFKTTATYLLDNNEPNCILSPRLLRIPNSSYKILGYIPDISGHGNNGVIHNSAYAEGSGVNEDGSYQLDGVDDFVTIPTIAGKQVLIKLNWQNKAIGNLIYDQRDNGSTTSFAIVPISINDTTKNRIAYQERNANGITYIDGIRNEYIESYSLENIIHNITITNPDVSNKTVVLGASNKTTADYFAKYALYDFMLFDEISTDDKIKELNEYVGIEAKVELPPYYWDAYGKTNLDADKATIQQRGVAVGDYDLTNYNHAYEGMSGYNGYPVVFGANKTWTNESNGYVTSITSNTIHITNVLNAGLALLYSYVKYNGNLQNIKEIPPFKIEIKGLEGRSKFIYKYLATSDATKETNLYLGNGTHELPKSFLPTEALVNDAVVGFSISPIEEGVTNFLSDITIEVLPEYENGLAYDGVSDFTDNKNIPILTDFTFIIKREILGLETNESMLVIKGDKVYNNGIGNAFILEHNSNGVNYVYSYGKLNQIKRDDSKIIYLTPESYNGNPIIKGENGDNLGLVLSRHWRGIIYKTILYSKTISLLQINFLKNLMEKDEIIDLNNPIFIKDK